ncbi:hypothetical protein [Infirmifilum sp. SLHALR2]
MSLKAASPQTTSSRLQPSNGLPWRLEHVGERKGSRVVLALDYFKRGKTR